MKHFTLFFVIIFLSCAQLSAQQLSTKTTISVVTCGPGSDLYTAFGHSAFRVFDPVSGIDKIYNYGTFDFNAPNFYLNFMEGNMIYQLSTTNFSRFLRIYQYENRWVKTQVLNLSIAEVQELFDFLENNATPKNRDYRYDFFYDNCATKIETVLKAVLKEKVSFPNKHITTQKTHRDLIADYTQEFKWGKFGIDLALGSVIDDEATKDDYKFLPDYIFDAFNEATIQKENGQESLVIKEISILKEEKTAASADLLTPINVVLFLSLFIVFITYRNYHTQKRSKWLDFSLYLLTGLTGIVVLLLWFATLHTATYRNFNFLWAFAPNVVVAFYMLKTTLPTWINYYNKLLLVLLAGMLLLWAFKIQVFNSALTPLILALIIRYAYLMRIKT